MIQRCRKGSPAEQHVQHCDTSCRSARHSGRQYWHSNRLAGLRDAAAGWSPKHCRCTSLQDSTRNRTLLAINRITTAAFNIKDDQNTVMDACRFILVEVPTTSPPGASSGCQCWGSTAGTVKTPCHLRCGCCHTTSGRALGWHIQEGSGVTAGW